MIPFKKLLLFAITMVIASSCISQNKTKKDKMDNERLTYFSFDHHNSMAMYHGEKYKVSLEKDGRIHLIIDEAFPDEKELYINDSSIFDSLLAIVRTYKTDKYKKNYQPKFQVFDGDSWNLYYKYNTGRSVSADGYMAYPDNYRDMRKALSAYFKKWRETTEGAITIDYFKITCKNNKGRDEEYSIERGEKEATITLRDAEQNILETITVSNEYLNELQKVANAAQLKNTMYDYHATDENATRCDFVARYNNGETYSGYTCFTKYIGHKESSLLDFFQQWKKQ